MYGDPCDSVAVFGPGRLARHHRIARKPNLAPGAVAFSTAQSSADTTVDPSPLWEALAGKDLVLHKAAFDLASPGRVGVHAGGPGPPPDFREPCS